MVQKSLDSCVILAHHILPQWLSSRGQVNAVQLIKYEKKLLLSWLSALGWSFLAIIIIHIHQTWQHWIICLYLYQLRKLFAEALIVTEEIYDVRESLDCPRTFAPYFSYSMNKNKDQVACTVAWNHKNKACPSKGHLKSSGSCSYVIL